MPPAASRAVRAVGVSKQWGFFLLWFQKGVSSSAPASAHWKQQAQGLGCLQGRWQRSMPLLWKQMWSSFSSARSDPTISKENLSNWGAPRLSVEKAVEPTPTLCCHQTPGPRCLLQLHNWGSDNSFRMESAKKDSQQGKGTRSPYSRRLKLALASKEYVFGGCLCGETYSNWFYKPHQD